MVVAPSPVQLFPEFHKGQQLPERHMFAVFEEQEEVPVALIGDIWLG